MHVAICADGVFPKSVGGVQRHTRLLAEHVARRHPDIRVTVMHTHPEQRFFAGIGNIEEVHIDPRPGRQNYVKECWDLSGRFASALGDIPSAVVYSQALAIWKGAKTLSPRLIVNPHGLEAFQATSWRDRAMNFPFRIAIGTAMKRARRVVSLGGTLTDILRRQLPDADRRIVVLPNGVSPPDNLPSRVRSPGHPCRFLYVGRFYPNKGVRDLIAATQLLNERRQGSDVLVELVGDGPLFGPLKAATKEGNVRFRGSVSDAELEQAYADADVLVLPTLFEGMPTVVLEAMARGLPILVTDVGATRELVDGTNGEIVAKRDPDALAMAMRRMVEMGPTGRAALGGHSLEKVQRRFTWDRVADAHVEVFRQFAG